MKKQHDKRHQQLELAVGN
jgi:hypothetical protein